MDHNSSKNQELSLNAKIEALLFVAPGTISINQLATVLEQTPSKIEEALKELTNQYKHRGIRLQTHRGRLQLVSAPQSSSLIEHFLGLEATTRISQAALETMAIIAYRQHVTRPEVDAIRGVNSDGVIKTLLSRGLIEEVGRGTGPGRPILYSTTPEFLGYFGLTSIADLPPLNLNLNFEQNDPTNNDILKD